MSRSFRRAWFVAIVLALAPSVSAQDLPPEVTEVGPGQFQMMVEVSPPPFAPVPSLVPTFTLHGQSCCSVTCNLINQSGCPGGVVPCCALPEEEDPCAEAGDGDQNVCGCYPECSLTCAVGGRTCHDLCYFGPLAPVPKCDSLCQAIVGEMLAVCASAMEATAGSFSYGGVTVSCDAGEYITGCAPLQVPCAPVACIDCLYCSAMGLCGVQVTCGEEPPPATPTATPTTTPTGTSGIPPTATPTATPPEDGGNSGEVFLR